MRAWLFHWIWNIFTSCIRNLIKITFCRKVLNHFLTKTDNLFFVHRYRGESGRRTWIVRLWGSNQRLVCGPLIYHNGPKSECTAVPSSSPSRVGSHIDTSTIAPQWWVALSIFYFFGFLWLFKSLRCHTINAYQILFSCILWVYGSCIKSWQR